MIKLTKKQSEILWNIASGMILKRSGHGFVWFLDTGEYYGKASIAVKSLLLVFPDPLLADLPTQDGIIYLTTPAWNVVFDQPYTPKGKQAELTAIADQRVQTVLGQLVREDGDDQGVAGEYSHRHVEVR